MPFPKFEDYEAPWEKHGTDFNEDEAKRLIYNRDRDKYKKNAQIAERDSQIKDLKAANSTEGAPAANPTEGAPAASNPQEASVASSTNANSKPSEVEILRAATLRIFELRIDGKKAEKALKFMTKGAESLDDVRSSSVELAEIMGIALDDKGNLATQEPPSEDDDNEDDGENLAAGLYSDLEGGQASSSKGRMAGTGGRSGTRTADPEAAAKSVFG